MKVLPTDLPREYVVNNLYFNSTKANATNADYQVLTDTVMSEWSKTPGVHWGYGGTDLTIVAYNLADPTPRPEKAMSHHTAVSPISDTTQARQVALCVSYYAGRNLPRYRGRVFLMPLNNAGASERPGSAIIDGAKGLITAVAAATNAATPQWTHFVYSKALGDLNPVTTWWVNDVWDTQRRRAPKETVRHHTP